MSNLRLMSNNIWFIGDNDPRWEAINEDCSSEARAPGFVRVYSETMPDVVGFQECTARLSDNIMQLLKNEKVSYTLVWGRNTPIIYRTDKFELVDSDYFIYPDHIEGLEGKFNDAKTKSYCIAVLKTKEDGKLLIFATTHLWWRSSKKESKNYYPNSDEARAYQINLLTKRVENFISKYNCPAVIVGDFNAVYDSQAVSVALNNGYTHAYHLATDYRDETSGHHFCFASGFDNFEKTGSFNESIDQILIKNAPKNFVKRFERYYPQYYMKLSDHFPVWIDIEL